MIWHNQCNGGQKRKRREHPIKIALEYKEYVNVVSRFGCRKNSRSLALHICLLRPQKEILAN